MYVTGFSAQGVTKAAFYDVFCTDMFSAVLPEVGHIMMFFQHVVSASVSEKFFVCPVFCDFRLGGPLHVDLARPFGREGSSPYIQRADAIPPI